MHKASALAGPLAMMYEGDAITKENSTLESEDGGPDYEEDFYLPGVHLSLCDGIGVGYHSKSIAALCNASLVITM